MLSKSKNYYYDNSQMREPCSPDNVKDFLARKTSNNKGGGDNSYESERPDLCRGRDAYMAKDFTRNKRSVWSVNTKPYKGSHFATFPPDLIEPCILAGCPEGGTVIDPFGGSGTTAGVAIEHNRKAILCELNPEYLNLITARVKSLSGYNNKAVIPDIAKAIIEF
jgi:DNA modification methylase